MTGSYKIFKNKKLKTVAPIIISIIILILSQLTYLNSNNSPFISSNSKDWEGQRAPQTSAARYYNNIQWLENNDFNDPSIDPWLNTSSGDSDDIEAGVSSGQAEYIVLGDEDRKEISNVFTDPAKWVAFNKSDSDNNPDQGYEVSVEGVNCSHYWSDTESNQIPKIYWRYNVSMGIDMSDYEITSASIDAKMNASFNRNVDVPYDTIAAYGGDDPEIGGDRALNRVTQYDYAHFTVEVSDMETSQDSTYIIAENKTLNLGRYDGVTPYLKLEKDINSENEEDIKYYLSRVLDADPGHGNFTIILGISTFSADNHYNLYDYDYYEDLRIKSVNLTFTYKKKIDKYTTLSWNQEGGMINYTSVQVTDAQLNFDYGINKDWNDTTSSQFSEFRIFINNKMQIKYPTPRLVNYDYATYQGNLIEARTGGFDVTNLIPLEENITLAIQVYIGDNFELNETVTVSIDNVDLLISYVVFYNATGGVAIIGDDDGKGTVTEEPWIFLIIAIAAIVGGSCLGAYLVAYELYLKYPKPVRKVRKYRKTLKKKDPPSIDILERKSAFKTAYNSKSADILSDMKGKPKVQILKKNKIIEKTLESNPPNKE